MYRVCVYISNYVRSSHLEKVCMMISTKASSRIIKNIVAKLWDKCRCHFLLCWRQVSHYSRPDPKAQLSVTKTKKRILGLWRSTVYPCLRNRPCRCGTDQVKPDLNENQNIEIPSLKVLISTEYYITITILIRIQAIKILIGNFGL